MSDQTALMQRKWIGKFSAQQWSHRPIYQLQHYWVKRRQHVINAKSFEFSAEASTRARRVSLIHIKDCGRGRT